MAIQRFFVACSSWVFTSFESKHSEPTGIGSKWPPFRGEKVTSIRTEEAACKTWLHPSFWLVVVVVVEIDWLRRLAEVLVSAARKKSGINCHADFLRWNRWWFISYFWWVWKISRCFGRVCSHGKVSWWGINGKRGLTTKRKQKHVYWCQVILGSWPFWDV